MKLVFGTTKTKKQSSGTKMLTEILITGKKTNGVSESIDEKEYNKLKIEIKGNYENNTHTGKYSHRNKINYK